MTKTSAEYNKIRRDNARAAGICQTCTKAPVADGLSTCAACTRMKRKWNAEYAAPGMRGRTRWTQPKVIDRFLICCQSHGKHRVGCDEQQHVAA